MVMGPLGEQLACGRRKLKSPASVAAQFASEVHGLPGGVLSEDIQTNRALDPRIHMRTQACMGYALAPCSSKGLRLPHSPGTPIATAWGILGRGGPVPRG